MSNKSNAELQLHRTWKLFEDNAYISVRNLDKLKASFSKALLKIEELRLSRERWRARAENAEHKLKKISSR